MTPNTELSDDLKAAMSRIEDLVMSKQMQAPMVFTKMRELVNCALSAVSRSEVGEPAPVGEPAGYVHPQLLRELQQGKTLSIPLVHPSEADLEEGGDVPLYASPLPQEGAAGSGSDSVQLAGGWGELRKGEHYELAGSGSGGVKGEALTMQLKLIDAKNALQHAADRETPEVARFYRKRAMEVAEVISALSPTSPPNSKTADGEAACPTCRGEGEVDERIGGDPFAAHVATCPDCNGTGNAAVDASRGGEHG